MGGARARCPALRDSKTQGKWTSTRARGESCANRPQVVQGTCAPTGAARLRPPDVLRLIRGRSNGSGETRATELPKPSAAVFTQVRLAANLHPCQSIASRLAIARGICARFSASGGRLALSVRGKSAAPAFRNPQRQFSHYATAFQLRYGRNQPPLNHFPNHPTTAFQPRPNHRKPQPLHNRPSAARRTIPRLAKTHDSTILRVESKNDSDSTIPHPRSLNRQHRAAWPWLVY